MKKSIAIALFALLALGAAGTLEAAIVGDIDNDGTISLAEAIYALQVTAGNVTNVPDSCAITGAGAWTEGAVYNLCDVVRDNGENYICTQAHQAGLANRPPDNTNWEIISLTGQNGLNSAIAITTEPAGENCADGGRKIEAGLDTDDDGAPDIALTAPSYICNGATGGDGADGAAGAEGAAGANGLNSAIAITPETAGENCADGGQKIEAGLDTDGNGAPDASLTTAYVCNGATGNDGAAGAAGSDGYNSLVNLAQESYLTATVCEFGGTIIEVGLDSDRSGTLDRYNQQGSDEVTGETTLCNSTAPATATNSVGMTFNLIPAGTFTMGGPASSAPVVTFSRDIYMQATEVTQAQYEAIMDTTPSANIGCADCPVDSISWYDAQLFIDELNLLGEGNYRLPTEAEWEYACRAGSSTNYANNLTSAEIDQIGWVTAAATQPVGGLAPNAWGLYDMHGNLFEWMQDWFGVLGTDPVTDPQGPETGSGKVLRGGAYNLGAAYASASDRSLFENPANPNVWFGFRVVVTK